jgi:HK97 family phage prohead protease
MTTTRSAPKPGSPLRHDGARVLRALDPNSRIIRFVLSDGSVDRMGDTIDPDGWETDAFMRNPVILWAHDSSAPPIGRALNVWSDGTRLMADIEFVPAETYAFADTIYQLVLRKFLSAGSVGFLPHKFKWADDDDRPFGINFQQQELLEFSICPVPANANALIDARSKWILSMRDFNRLRRDGELYA